MKFSSAKLLRCVRVMVISSVVVSCLAGPVFSDANPYQKATENAPRRVSQSVVPKTRSAEPADPSSAPSPSPEIAVRDAETIARKLDFVGALRILQRAERQYQDSALLPCEIGRIYVRAEDPVRAAEQFSSALKLDPSFSGAEIGLAFVDLMNRSYEQAESRLRNVLARPGLSEPDRVRAHVVFARSLLDRGKNQLAAVEAQQALDLDETDSEALSLLAFLKAAARRPDQARDLARRAIASDPYNAGALRLLAQYVNGAKGYRRTSSSRAESCYRIGKDLERAGKIADARRQFELAVDQDPEYYRALLSLSAVCLRLADYHAAAGWASKALSIDSDGALAYLNLSLAYSGMKAEASKEIGAPDYRARYSAHPAPAIDSSLVERVFTQYNELSAEERRVVDCSVSGLVDFLEVLARRGSRFHFVPADVRITEYPGYDGGSVEKTFDGRYYASIRGVGGSITLCGIEGLEEAARCGFNSIAHEFAHEVQRVALTAEQQTRLKVLYQEAREQGRTLDYYSASDEYEYFAVGYEAFVSEFKRPSLGATAGHTRDELKRRDPALFDFILELGRAKCGAAKHRTPAARYSRGSLSPPDANTTNTPFSVSTAFGDDVGVRLLFSFLRFQMIVHTILQVDIGDAFRASPSSHRSGLSTAS